MVYHDNAADADQRQYMENLAAAHLNLLFCHMASHMPAQSKLQSPLVVEGTLYIYYQYCKTLPSSADGRLLYIHPVFVSGVGGDVTINFVSIKPSIKVNTVHITYFGAQVTPEGPRGPLRTPWEPLRGPWDHLRGQNAQGMSLVANRTSLGSLGTP